MADPLFSEPASLWARAPAVSTLKTHTGLLSYIFLSVCRHRRLLWPLQLHPHRCRPCSLCSSPLHSLHHRAREKTGGCRLTAREHAAATIIALIACFFCGAEISSRATILLSKPPKNLQVKMERRGGKKDSRGSVHQWDPSLPTHCRTAHTCTLAPPLK